MSPAAQRFRVALFGVVCAALVAAAIGFAGGAQPSAPPSRSGVGSGSALASRGGASGSAVAFRARLERQARRFLAAFFRYEVGELGPGVRQELSACSTRGFAAELLGSPPRRSRSVPAARTGLLRISVDSVSPPRALVSGAAQRGSEAEQFSFVFEAVGGAWLASGPGE